MAARSCQSRNRISAQHAIPGFICVMKVGNDKTMMIIVQTCHPCSEYEDCDDLGDFDDD